MTPPSTLEFFKIGAYMIIFGYLWRTGSAILADRPSGKAAGFIH